jgi:hypothetical protein
MWVSERGGQTHRPFERDGGRLAMEIAQQRMTLDLGDVVPGFVLDVDALFQSLYLD